MKIFGIIPARLNSTRLPKKALIKIKDITLTGGSKIQPKKSKLKKKPDLKSKEKNVLDRNNKITKSKANNDVNNKAEKSKTKAVKKKPVKKIKSKINEDG